MTTRTEQAISSDECSKECPTGLRLTWLSNNATCEPERNLPDQRPRNGLSVVSGRFHDDSVRLRHRGGMCGAQMPAGIFSFQGKHLRPLPGRDLPAVRPEEQLLALLVGFHHQSGRRPSRPTVPPTLPVWTGATISAKTTASAAGTRPMESLTVNAPAATRASSARHSPTLPTLSAEVLVSFNHFSTILRLLKTYLFP